MYQFQKKDGSLIDFDPNKIIIGIIKAGGPPEEAEAVADKVQTWLPSVVISNVVKSADVREKVVAELRIVDPPVAASFESYKKG